MTIEIVPDQDVELLRLEAGQLDMTATEMRPEDYTPLKRAADAGRVQVLDLGVGFDADSLWFNLKPGGSRPERPSRAVAAARRASARDFDGGRSAAVREHRVPRRRRAGVRPDHARESEMVRESSAGAARSRARAARARRDWPRPTGMATACSRTRTTSPCGFRCWRRKATPRIERGAAVIRDELKKIGVTVDVVALDGERGDPALSCPGTTTRCYFRVTATDTDPAEQPRLLAQLRQRRTPWNLEQKSPATEWEARIDALMRRQMASPDEAERKRLFDQVQTIFAEHLPMIQFVAPRIYVAASTRVTNLTPTAFTRPQLLWSPDTIAVVH